MRRNRRKRHVNPNRRHDQQKTDREQHAGPEDTPQPAHVDPPALGQQNCACHKENKWVEWGLHTLEVLALTAAAVVGLLAIRASSKDAEEQRILMQGQLDAMQGQINEMRAEQRPNLWVTSDLGAPHLVTRGADVDHAQVVWTVQLTNYGKGFVARGSWHTYIRVSNREFVRSLGQPDDVEIGPVAPSQVITTSVVSSEVSRPRSGVFSDAIGDVQIKLVIDYWDTTGNKYKSIICLGATNAKSIGFCPGGVIQ